MQNTQTERLKKMTLHCYHLALSCMLVYSQKRAITLVIRQVNWFSPLFKTKIFFFTCFICFKFVSFANGNYLNYLKIPVLDLRNTILNPSLRCLVYCNLQVYRVMVRQSAYRILVYEPDLCQQQITSSYYQVSGTLWRIFNHSSS